MLIDAHLLTGFGIGDDAACDSSGNLAHKNLGAVGCLYHDGRTLVFGARLRQISCKEATRMVLHILHHSGYRGPVGMHIENRHKD